MPYDTIGIVFEDFADCMNRAVTTCGGFEGIDIVRSLQVRDCIWSVGLMTAVSMGPTVRIAVVASRIFQLGGEGKRRNGLATSAFRFRPRRAMGIRFSP